MAVPWSDELKLTEHFPVVSVMQLGGLSEPMSEEKDTITLLLASDVDTVIVDVCTVVMVVGLAETESEGVGAWVTVIVVCAVV